MGFMMSDEAKSDQIPSMAADMAKAEKVTIKAITAWGKNHSGVTKDYLHYIKRANEMLQSKYPGEV
jgi:hypothetical protein